MKTPSVFMVRPIRFGYNPETAVNNAFQVNPKTREGQDAKQEQIALQAQKEFDFFVEKLQEAHVEVLVIQDSAEPHTPDSIFPNNWISTHENGQIVLYPMFAKNRRLERKPTVFDALKSKFEWSSYLDLTPYEEQALFLEGTGSFVLDRPNQVAFACLSPRTDENVFREFCKKFAYEPLVFQALDRSGTPIYHTNVMMCVADRYVVINLACIPEPDRSEVLTVFKRLNKEVIAITMEQMEHFAGNMLQVFDKRGQTKLVMSSQAFDSLTLQQKEKLQFFDEIIHAPLDTIEKNGGGSARCMIAEVYLPKKELEF